MAVSVVLDLGQAVSAPDLRHFLSYLPEAFDPSEDLRSAVDADGATRFFVVALPLPGQHD